MQPQQKISLWLYCFYKQPQFQCYLLVIFLAEVACGQKTAVKIKCLFVTKENRLADSEW